jgi:hypothetical protein
MSNIRHLLGAILLLPNDFKKISYNVKEFWEDWRIHNNKTRCNNITFRVPREGENRESGENPERTRRCNGDSPCKMPLGNREGVRGDEPKPEDLPGRFATG